MTEHSRDTFQVLARSAVFKTAKARNAWRYSLVVARLLVLWGLVIAASPASAEFRLATFTADVTSPLGHPGMGGGIAPAKEIVDPLYAKGVVLLGSEQPVVLLSIDWCEIRNDAYDRWRTVLAEAAGTTKARVLVSAIHQHDAPVADLTAQKLLDEVGLEKSLVFPEFHEEAVQKTAAALRTALPQAQPVTHYGTGVAIVEDVTSNRRAVHPDGTINFGRGSASPESLQQLPIDLVDPWLRSLSFWNGDTPVAVLSSYSVHPMSHYGKGYVTADFPGMARAMREKDMPGVQQIYFSGCSGDVTAGKFNDGSPENRPVLAKKLYDGMKAAFEGAERHPLTQAAFRSTPLFLPPRSSEGFTEEDLWATLRDETQDTFKRNLAAMGLSWRMRCDAGIPIDVGALDFGKAVFLLLPAETFVQYQITAQGMRPDAQVMTAGYGESAPGYTPSAAATEDDFNTHHTWLWVDPKIEPLINLAVQKVLLPGLE